MARLRALAIVHEVMESEIAACNDKRAAAVAEEDLRKLPLLAVD